MGLPEFSQLFLQARFWPCRSGGVFESMMLPKSEHRYAKRVQALQAAALWSAGRAWRPWVSDRKTAAWSNDGSRITQRPREQLETVQMRQDQAWLDLAIVLAGTRAWRRRRGWTS